MWAQLFLLSCFLLSAFLVFRVIDSGLGGPLSLWWFRRKGKANEHAVVTSAPVELKIQLPPMELRKRFFDVIAATPKSATTGEAITSGPQYEEYVERARQALLDRAIEGVLVFRNVDTLYREAFCKFSQHQASQRAWQDAQNVHQYMDKELRDICEWAGTLLKGWDMGILPQASQIIQKKQEAEVAQFKQVAAAVHAMQLSSSRNPEEIEAERQRELQRARKAEESASREEEEAKKQREQAKAKAKKAPETSTPNKAEEEAKRQREAAKQQTLEQEAEARRIREAAKAQKAADALIREEEQRVSGRKNKVN